MEQENTGKKVLIIEDNPLNMKLFRDILQVHGYETFEDLEGRETLPLAYKHKPDLIILDIQLPNHSGLDIVRRIKADKKLADIPILAVTALALQEQEMKALEAGCAHYLAKPFTIGTFLSTVENFVGKSIH